jgi:hypothetical protein
MYRLFLFLLAASALGASLVKAQQPNPFAIPEPSRVASTDALSELEKRRQRLERDVAQTQEKIAAVKDASKADARLVALVKAARSSQEDLLKVTFQIECARARTPTSSTA